jgi:predicted Zn-dependent protease
MYLNSERWFYGSKESKLRLDDYRQYMVSHEIGHILGFDHEKCPCRSCKAPIMMQQTLGIGKCIPNTKITKHGK